MEISIVNGEPGLVFREHGRLFAAAAFAIAGGRIDSVYAVINPDKLSGQ
jgi:RNA polymerase sigma-70 factor (ECF subfamily)